MLFKIIRVVLMSVFGAGSLVGSFFLFGVVDYDGYDFMISWPFITTVACIVLFIVSFNLYDIVKWFVVKYIRRKSVRYVKSIGRIYRKRAEVHGVFDTMEADARKNFDKVFADWRN